MMETDGGFADLLQQAQQLTANTDVASLPRVERNLAQIRETAAKLAYRTPYCGSESSDVKASLLLSARGYDVQQVLPKLESLSAAKTFEPLDPVRETDIQGFLKNERENALLSVIEQTRKNTFDETSQRHWDSLECEWENEKHKILNALVDSAGETVEFIQESDTLLSDSLAMHGRSTMNSVELAYAKQVYILNESIVQGGIRPSLVNLFLEASSRMDNINITELWSVVRHMTDLVILPADSLVKMRSSHQMQASFVKQALKYLQQSYIKYIEMKVHSNPQQAQRGGVPGTYNLVRSFLNVTQPMVSFRGLEDATVEGHPTWAMIYHCMRCGDLKATAEVVNRACQHLGNFTQFFNEYASSENRRLSADTERDIRLQYQRSIRNSTDPYKRAVYCIIGQCDAREDHSEVANSTDDYLWLKLSQVTFDESDIGREKLSLVQLQTMLLEEFGETHFAAFQQPYLYFRVLFLTAQFEAAIEFLARIDVLRCYAVHVALVLYDMKLLLLPSSAQAPLLLKDNADPMPLRRLNFVRLILMYTRKFEVSDPREALQYFYFLRDLKTPSGDSLFMSCVSELVLETREFDMLLGVLQTDGSRRHGAIDRFRLDTQKIIEQVARDVESKGQFEDSVRLYDLAMNHEKVLELLNKLLSQVVSQPSSNQSPRDRLKQLAVAVAQRYRNMGIEGSRSATSTFYLQLDLITFFDLFHNGHLDKAYSVMQDLKFLPLTLDAVEHKVTAFRGYSDEVRRILPDVLIAMMTFLLNQYRAKSSATTMPHSPLVHNRSSISAQGGSEDYGRQSYIATLRTQAQALIMFAGMIPYRLPGDTNARLVQMEVLMH